MGKRKDPSTTVPPSPSVGSTEDKMNDDSGGKRARLLLPIEKPNLISLEPKGLHRHCQQQKLTHNGQGDHYEAVQLMKAAISKVQSLATDWNEATALNKRNELAINILHHNIQLANEQIEKIQEDASSKEEVMKIQYLKKEDETKRLHRQVEDLSNDLKEKQVLAETLESSNASLETDNQEWQRKMKDVTHQLDVTKANVESLEKRLSKSTKLSSRKDKTIRSLNRKIETASQLSQKIREKKTPDSTMKKENKKLAKQVTSKDAARAKLSRLLQDERTKNESLERQVIDVRATNGILQEENVELKQKLKTLQTENKNLEYKLSGSRHSEQRLKEGTKELEQSCREWKSKFCAMKDQIKSQLQRENEQKKSRELKSKLKIALQEQNKLLTYFHELRRDKHNMEQKVATMQIYAEENERLVEEIEQMRMNHAMEIGFMEG